MPYAPGIEYRGGEYLAAGINRGIEAIAGALMQRAEQRRKKEEWAAAAPKLQKLVDKLAPDSGIEIDKDTPKEMVPQLVEVAGRLEQQAREKPLRDLQIENEKLRQRIGQSELDTAAKNAAALGAAAPMMAPRVKFPEALRADMQGQPPPMQPADYQGALATYAARGGTDVRALAQLGELAQSSLKAAGRAAPGMRDFGKDAWGRPVQGLVDAQGNVSRITPPTDPKDVVVPFKIGDKNLFRVGNDILDDKGVPVRAPSDKPLDPLQQQMLVSQYQQALEIANTTGSGLFELDTTAERNRANARQRANLLADRLGFQRPFEESNDKSATAKSAAPKSAEQPAGSGKSSAPVLPYQAADVAAELKRRGLSPR